MCPFFCSGAKSREHYRDFTEPKKFEGALELVHREADDSIYRVPYRSLAHLVRWEEHLEWPRESKLPRLAPYVAAIDDPSRSQLSTVWLSANQLRITGQVDPETMVGVPVTYDAGWRATQGGRELEIVQDNLGFMLLRAGPGNAPIDLIYRGTAEQYLMVAISALVWLGALGFWLSRPRTHAPSD